MRGKPPGLPLVPKEVEIRWKDLLTSFLVEVGDRLSHLSAQELLVGFERLRQFFGRSILVAAAMTEDLLQQHIYPDGLALPSGDVGQELDALGTLVQAYRPSPPAWGLKRNSDFPQQREQDAGLLVLTLALVGQRGI